MPYRPRELWLLLALTVSLGVGLAVDQFRSGFPDLAERLERLDAEPTPAPPPLPSRPSKLSAAEIAREGALDLNEVSAEDLRRLPGIGTTLAGEIVRARERRGRFATVDDLLIVPGMGPRKLERVRDLLTVRESPRTE